MYIIQIKQPAETWIAAICQMKDDAAEYLKTMSAKMQADALLYEIPFEYYPFILIENTETLCDSNSYFEFCAFEELQMRIVALRARKVESDDHIYFKYFYISEPYAQMVSDENFMKYMRYTSVTNYIIDQPYPVSFFHEEIKKNVSTYDIDRLDQLFEHTKTRFTSQLEKEDLALNGYESLFWDLNYDHACGKLTEAGIRCLVPMVEKMEALLGEKKWKHRSFAFHILLEQTCKEDSSKTQQLLKETVEAFEQYLISEPEEKLEIHRLLALAYRRMIGMAADSALQFWQQAVMEIEKAIDFNPLEASWSLLLELIYTPYAANENITAAQTEAQKHFTAKTLDMETRFGTAMAYPLALAYQHLREHLEWTNDEHLFPKTTALRWAEKAIAYNPAEITRIDLHQCAEFFHNIGLQTKRIDFLVKTISLYERALKPEIDCGLEVYYIADLWKQIAEIHSNNKEYALADDAIIQAISIYKKHLAQVKRNRSAHMHYAGFMEYCYTYEGKISKPTLAELKSIATEIEIEAEGFHSSPYIMMMRIALFEKNEAQAIFECTKSLILHELCADSTFNALAEEFADSNFSQFKTFLQETKAFMDEVHNNYYYNPEIKWKQLRTMSALEILDYWKKRKEEIRNRPFHEKNLSREM